MNQTVCIIECGYFYDCGMVKSKINIYSLETGRAKKVPHGFNANQIENLGLKEGKIFTKEENYIWIYEREVET